VSRSAHDWYVLWRPPAKQVPPYIGKPEAGHWETYQQGLTRRQAERIASKVEYILAPRWFGHNVPTRVGQGKPPSRNPPWTTRALARDWSAMQAQVAPEWMPVFSKPHASKKGELVVTLDALGCGAYGCVLPTSDPAVVLKVTSDDSEAKFATEILPDKSEIAKDGFVHYLDTAALHSEHKGSELTALWRQSAEDVGNLADVEPDLVPLVDHSWSVAQVALEQIVTAGEDADDLLQEAAAIPADPANIFEANIDLEGYEVADQIYDSGTDAEQVARALDYFRSANEQMKGTPLARVGAALNALLDEGVFVGDVHEGNLGRVVDDDGNEDWVITDPGNVIILPGPWRR